MPASTTQQIPPAQLSSVKNKMAVAYMHALNSTINYTFQESNREFDNLGIDLSISSFLVGQNRNVASEANQIYVQLKGTSINRTRMVRETDTHIEYNLTKDLGQVGTMYLIVVLLQSDENIEEWRVMSPTNVLMMARAYYIRVNDTIPSGFVKIPKENLLTPETYKQLFSEAATEALQ